MSTRRFVDLGQILIYVDRLKMCSNLCDESKSAQSYHRCNISFVARGLLPWILNKQKAMSGENNE